MSNPLSPSLSNYMGPGVSIILLSTLKLGPRDQCPLPPSNRLVASTAVRVVRCLCRSGSGGGSGLGVNEGLGDIRSTSVRVGTRKRGGTRTGEVTERRGTDLGAEEGLGVAEGFGVKKNSGDRGDVSKCIIYRPSTNNIPSVSVSTTLMSTLVESVFKDRNFLNVFITGYSGFIYCLPVINTYHCIPQSFTVTMDKPLYPFVLHFLHQGQSRRTTHGPGLLHVGVP